MAFVVQRFSVFKELIRSAWAESYPSVLYRYLFAFVKKNRTRCHEFFLHQRMGCPVKRFGQLPIADYFFGLGFWLRANSSSQQVSEILEQFRQEGVVHEAYASDRQRSVEELRADLSHVLTGMLHQRELEACVGSTRKQIEHEEK